MSPRMHSRHLTLVTGGLLLWMIVLGVWASPPHLFQASRVQAQGVSTTQIFEPFAFENLSISSSAVGFTASTYAPGGGNISARKARCTVNSFDIRYRVDGGGNPTSSVGHLIDVGTNVPPTFELWGSEIRLFRAIRAEGSDATASCTFYR